MGLYEPYLQFMHKLADASDLVTLKYFRANSAVENKVELGFDPVTEADRESEKVIRDLITREFPDHGIIGEEYGAINETAEFVWVIDPIDGTRSYVSGIPAWGTLIGLRHNDQPVAGLMSQPFTKERFFGEKAGSFLQYEGIQKSLNTRNCESISEAVLLNTTPALFDKKERPIFEKVEKQVRLIRYGTDCYGYAMLASGHADLVIESNMKIHDIFALIPIVEGAGGIITDWQGNSASNGGQILACGNKRLHEALIIELQ